MERGKKLARNRTKVNLTNILKINKNYHNVSANTGIDSTRLKQLKAGAKANRSESAKIANYAKKDLTISPQKLAGVSAFSRKEIEGKKTFKPKKEYSDERNVIRVRNSIGTLRYQPVTNGGIVTGDRKNGEKVIYYILRIHDLNTGKIVYGHGFKNYREVQFMTYNFTIMDPIEYRYGPNGEIYSELQFFFAPFDIPIAL